MDLLALPGNECIGTAEVERWVELSIGKSRVSFPLRFVRRVVDPFGDLGEGFAKAMGEFGTLRIMHLIELMEHGLPGDEALKLTEQCPGQLTRCWLSTGERRFGTL